MRNTTTPTKRTAQCIACVGIALLLLVEQIDAQTRSRELRLEEVIVTAQKRPEDVQSVPLSVTALGGDAITDKNMGDMNEVANYVPNLDVLAVPTFPSIYMRGLGSSYNRGFEQSVAILIDEVFYGRASYINQGLLDLEAIEVLRGPQGTLFGKNSSAGAIHFRSAQPEDEFAANAEVLLGDRSLRRYRVTATGPLIDDRVAWRLAVLDEERDGGVENPVTGIDEENRDNQALRLRLRWHATENLSLDATLNGGSTRQHGAGTQLIRVRDRHLAAMQVFDPTVNADAYDERTSLDHAGMADRETWDAIVKFDWVLGNGDVVTSISNYAWLDEDLSFDADFSPIPFLVLDNDEDLRQISQEFRITSEPGKLEYVAGLYFLRTDLAATYDIIEKLELNEILQLTGEGERRLCPQSSDPKACQDAILDDANSGRFAGETIAARMQSEGGAPPVETSFTRFNQLTTSAALFGQGTWHFRERWSLTVGLRFNYEEKELDVAHLLLNNRSGTYGNAVLSGSAGFPGVGFAPGPSPGGATIFPTILPGDTQFTAARSRDDFNVIPKVSVQYQLLDDAMAYVSIARGYKSGGYNAQPINDDQLEFDDEEATTYETGLKSEWLDGAGRLNVSVFHTDFDGLQVATFNGFAYVVGNAASATVKGVEFEALLVPAAGWLLGLNGAYTDAVYEAFPGAPCTAEEINPPPCNLSGKPLRLVPAWKTTFTLGYESQISDWPVIFRAGFTASYTSPVPLATDLDPVDTRVEGTTYGLQVGVRSLQDSWHVTLFGDNVTSHESLAGGQDAPAYRGSHFGGVYPDASYELELGMRF